MLHIISSWQRFITLVCATMICSLLHGMVFDSRFVPLYAKPIYLVPGACAFLSGQFLVFTGHSAWADRLEEGSREEEFGLFEFHGPYDQKVIDQALLVTGRSSTSLLRSDFQIRPRIPWHMFGQLHAICFAWYGYAQITSLWSIGMTAIVMHADNLMEWCLDPNIIRNHAFGDEREIFMARNAMHHLLGVTPGCFSKTGIGDLDFYLRFGGAVDYKFKCRRIDGGIKLGVIAPTAAKRDIDNPASFSFGGDGHTGIYVSFEGEFELKEDLKVGGLLRFIKRLSKTQLMRIPALTEPDIFGSIIAPVDVDPGLTLVFAPYGSFESVRQGLGFYAGYTLVLHDEDSLHDVRKDQAVPSNLDPVIKRSSWGTEHATIGLNYNFNFEGNGPWWAPKVSFYWDIPVNATVSKRADKTHAVSLLATVDF